MKKLLSTAAIIAALASAVPASAQSTGPGPSANTGTGPGVTPPGGFGPGHVDASLENSVTLAFTDGDRPERTRRR